MKKYTGIFLALSLSASADMISPLATFVNWGLLKPRDVATSTSSAYYGDGFNQTRDGYLDAFKRRYEGSCDNFVCGLCYVVRSENRVGLVISDSQWNDSMKQSSGCFVEGLGLAAGSVGVVYKAYTSTMLVRGSLIIGGWSSVALGLMCWGALRIKRGIAEARIEDPKRGKRLSYELFRKKVVDAYNDMVSDAKIESAKISRARSFEENGGAHIEYFKSTI